MTYAILFVVDKIPGLHMSNTDGHGKSDIYNDKMEMGETAYVKRIFDF